VPAASRSLALQLKPCPRAPAQLGSIVTFLWLVALKPKKKVD
jgi:hypothetical protein